MNNNMGSGKLRIAGTGLTGLVGSRVCQVLSQSFQFISLNRSTGLDITDADNVYKSIQRSNADMVLHLAAKTDVDACEQEKTEDIKKLRNGDIKNIRIADIDYDLWKGSHSCFGVNVVGTYQVAAACRKLNKKLIYISTDVVFDGTEKKPYMEYDLPNPINFYGQSKWMGEKIVQNMVKDHLILRIAYPYGIAPHQSKDDFVRKIAKRLSTKQQVNIIVDQIVTPTLIDDLANALRLLLSGNTTGIIHAVGSEPLTPYQAALALAARFRYDTSLIKTITLDDYYQGKAHRPRYLSIDNSNIRSLGVRMSTFEEGLKQITQI